MRQFSKYEMQDYSNWKIEIMKNLDYRDDVDQSKLLDKWIEKNESLIEKATKARIKTIKLWWALGFVFMFIMIFWDLFTDIVPYKGYFGAISALCFLMGSIKLGRYWLKYDDVFFYRTLNK